jgi:hypothetical protein
MQNEFKELITDFRNNIEAFKEKYNLSETNIFVEIKTDGPIGGMKDWYINGNRIPDVGFISELEFVLAQNGK